MQKFIKAGLFLLMLLLCYIGFLMYSNSLCLQRWDEARCALQALAMSKNHNFIVTYYQDLPDLWNTKPPLLIWIQALFFNLFSPSVFVFRLPTFIAAISLCFFIYWYFIKYHAIYFIGIVATIILISCNGISRMHGARTGEYDTLLVFFTTTYLIAFFQFLESKNNKWLALFFILLIAASLTKGIQALFFMPALLTYTVLTKNLKQLLTSTNFYIGIFAYLFFVIGYYLLREYYNPGFLKIVWLNELGGRYSDVIESHNAPFTFYFGRLWKNLNGFWFVLLVLSVPVVFKLKDLVLKKISLYLLGCSLIYLLVISVAQTKLDWYDMPVYPLLAIVIAISVVTVLSTLYKNKLVGFQQPLLLIFIAIIFSIPISLHEHKFFRFIKAQHKNDEMCAAFFLHHNLKYEKLNLNNCYVQGNLDCSYSGQIEFYQELYKNKNQQLHLFFWNQDTITAPCKLLTQYDATKHLAEQHFDYKILKEDNQLRLYELYKQK